MICQRRLCSWSLQVMRVVCKPGVVLPVSMWLPLTHDGDLVGGKVGAAGTLAIATVRDWTMKKDRMAELAMPPTVKPVALVADAILDVTTRGGLVPGSIWRVWSHADRSRADWTQCTPHRVRPDLLRRNHPPL